MPDFANAAGPEALSCCAVGRCMMPCDEVFPKIRTVGRAVLSAAEGHGVRSSFRALTFARDGVIR